MYRIFILMAFYHDICYNNKDSIEKYTYGLEIFYV